MARMIGLRLLKLVPVLFLVSLATFFIIDLVPGDPAIAVLGPDASPEQYEAVRTELGLDKPVVQRYIDWIGDALSGDLGNSLIQPGFSVTELIKLSLPITLELAMMGMLIALVVSVPLAMWAAYREGRAIDRIASATTAALISIPSFLAGLMLAYLFVFQPAVPKFVTLAFGLTLGIVALVSAFRRIGNDVSSAIVGRFVLGLSVIAATVLLTLYFPTFNRTGFVRLTSDQGLRENLRSAFLPALTIALTEIAIFTRLLRSDMITTLQEDFILSAKAKGMPPGKILWKEALRPSSFSLITLAGVALGRAIGGTVIVESIFGIQGIGRLVVQDGVVKGDYPIVQGGVLVIAVFYVLINLVVDVSYLYLDPRIRRRG
jgi:peptide/nickel transport system permease protein